MIDSIERLWHLSAFVQNAHYLRLLDQKDIRIKVIFFKDIQLRTTMCFFFFIIKNQCWHTAVSAFPTPDLFSARGNSAQKIHYMAKLQNPAEKIVTFPLLPYCKIVLCPNVSTVSTVELHKPRQHIIIIWYFRKCCCTFLHWL